MTRSRRWLALGGIVGPVAFVAAWSILGMGRAGYSPVHDPISELAAVGASSRPTMTVGLVAFAVGVGLYALVLSEGLPGGAGFALAVSAAASVGIAVFPLGADLGDGPHAAAAGVAYLSLGLAPILGARPMAQQGNQRWAVVSVAAGVVSGACLLTSVLASQWVGLAQRAGLTVADVWIVATALVILRGGYAVGHQGRENGHGGRRAT